jgi:hypothetical protein
MLMRVTVQLNDQSNFVTVEISDVRADGMLSAEFKTVELSSAQTRPQLLFCWRGIVTHRARSREKNGIERCLLN